MNRSEAYIIDAVGTPIRKRHGALSRIHSEVWDQTNVTIIERLDGGE